MNRKSGRRGTTLPGIASYPAGASAGCGSHRAPERNRLLSRAIGMPWLLACIASLTLLGCNPIPLETIEWQPDGTGSVQYSTNDWHYLGTAQCLPLSQEAEDPMTTVTAAVQKVSGSESVGFGIICCYQNEENHYRLMISTLGSYSAVAKVEGTNTVKVPWTDSLYINAGSGESNTIGLTRSPTGTFTVTINGHDVTTFIDTSFTGGLAGPYMAIGTSERERFPSVAEDCRFRMILPAAYP